MRDPRLVTDIDLEPSPASDDGRLLAFLEPRMCQRVPGCELAQAGKLQYNARCHSLRHVYGYVLINGEDGRTVEGRKKTWFALIGRLTLSQIAALEDLCRGKRMRYDTAIVQVFRQAGAYLPPRSGREKPTLIRNYPTMPHAESTPPSATPSFPTFGNLAKESYGVD
jgi:hypothetical protein